MYFLHVLLITCYDVTEYNFKILRCRSKRPPAVRKAPRTVNKTCERGLSRFLNVNNCKLKKVRKVKKANTYDLINYKSTSIFCIIIRIQMFNSYIYQECHPS